MGEMTASGSILQNIARQIEALQSELAAIELWDSHFWMFTAPDLTEQISFVNRQVRRQQIVREVGERRMEKENTERLIASLEMRSTVMAMHAERIARLAAGVSEEAHRLELWSVAMDLEAESQLLRQDAQGLWPSVDSRFISKEIK